MLPTPSPKRYLAAIVFLDLTGYNRLMAKNEAVALKILQELEVLIREEVALSRGHLVKFGPDGVYCSFPTGISAVSFALKIQRRIASRNEKAPSAERFRVRVGIHLGDVMKERGHLVGDAVNIAAQIKPLSDPGGIAMTDTIHSQIKNQLALRGTFSAKNGYDLPEHMQIFLVPPQEKFFFLWNLGKHLARTLALVLVGLLAFAGTFYLLHRDTSQRLGLFGIEGAADPDAAAMALILREEMDQELSDIPNLQWLGREGGLYLLSQVPGNSPAPEVKALEAAKKGGLHYLMSCRVFRKGGDRWGLKYRIQSVRTLSIVGAGTLEGSDADSLSQELRRQVAVWTAKHF